MQIQICAIRLYFPLAGGRSWNGEGKRWLLHHINCTSPQMSYWVNNIFSELIKELIKICASPREVRSRFVFLYSLRLTRSRDKQAVQQPGERGIWRWSLYREHLFILLIYSSARNSCRFKFLNVSQNLPLNPELSFLLFLTPVCPEVLFSSTVGTIQFAYPSARFLVSIYEAAALSLN